jgi:hypothetical protein
MSQKFPGGFITKSPVAPTTTAASGIWTLDQQEQYQQAGTWPAPLMYIEDMFSTYLYKGNNSTQTITNGIDLANNGGLVWIKNRGAAANNVLYDTSRGPKNVLSTNTNLAQNTDLSGYNFNSFLSTGFSLDPDAGGNTVNTNNNDYVSWSFKKQAKFFDVVTYTGNGSGGQTVAHSLGSAPGCVIVKRLNSNADWCVWHRGSGGNTDVTEFSINKTTQALRNPAGLDFGFTATTFTPYWVIGIDGDNGNINGAPYVAYLFAHNAGGFPASGSGSTNGITCGSFTTDSSGNATVNLGYEPQWLMTKSTGFAENWMVYDNMRGMPVGSSDARLFPNTSGAESLYDERIPTATGFNCLNMAASATYIYIAIRRGPMKTPTTGTSVYGTTTWVGSSGTKTTSAPATNFATGFSAFVKARDYPQDWGVFDQLRGTRPFLITNSTSQPINDGTSTGGLTILPTAIYLNGGSYFGGGGDGGGKNYTTYLFKRAPSFFDQLCYSGSGSATNITHNLSVAPELIFVKALTGGVNQNWNVCFANTGTNNLVLNDNREAFVDSTRYPTSGGVFFSTYFKVGTANGTNASGYTYSAYLFASCAGVSKVGTYTGTGALQTINCNFTTGARFVLIKRTDIIGDWFVYDSTSGISSGNDPYVLMDLLDSEVTGTNYVDTDTTGFKVTAAAPAGLNASGGTYIFLAIA